MKKYINFEQYPGFKPMWNPNEMKAAGVFQSANKNYFKVEVYHDSFDALKWYDWFYDFYKNPLSERNREEDMKMIALWVRALWKIWDDILMTEDPLTKECIITDIQKQQLLELGWNWEFKPNFDKKWMYQQFPLAR